MTPEREAYLAKCSEREKVIRHAIRMAKVSLRETKEWWTKNKHSKPNKINGYKKTVKRQKLTLMACKRELAMANADTQREINHVFKRQELFKAVVEHCPTVDPLERGEWVEDICCEGKIICNSCGNEAYVDSEEFEYVLFDYCPYCGAKMGVITNEAMQHT